MSEWPAARPPGWTPPNFNTADVVNWLNSNPTTSRTGYEVAPKAPPSSPDTMVSVPMNDRTEQYHQDKFTDEDMAKLEQEMADRNKQFEQSTPGSPNPVAAAAATGMSPWIPAGAAAVMVATGLGALGYSIAQSNAIAQEAAKLPPGTAFRPPPPTSYVPGDPIVAYYHNDPAMIFWRLRRRRRINGFL